MAPQASLKLVTPQAVEQDDVLRFERRGCTRHPISGQVTSLQQPADPQDHQARICSLQLLNISDTGLGAICPEPVDPGTRISVFFPPHAAEGGFDLFGTVVRCVHREAGHEIGIRFSQKHAA